MTATAARIDELEIDQSLTDSGGERATVPEEEDADQTLVAELKSRLAMPVEARAHGAAVELDVPEAYASALWQPATGRVLLPVLAPPGAPTASSREAVTVLLSRAAAAIAAVAVDAAATGLEVEVAAGATSTGLEVEVAAGATSTGRLDGLVAAFEAMTVAARMVVAEAEALAEHETLAERYLAMLAAGS